MSYFICIILSLCHSIRSWIFGYCSFSLVPFVLLGVCFTTLSIYCVITIVRKFGVIWIYRSCFIKLLLFWQLVFQIWILISVAFLGNNFTALYLGFYVFKDILLLWICITYYSLHFDRTFAYFGTIFRKTSATPTL